MLFSTQDIWVWRIFGWIGVIRWSLGGYFSSNVEVTTKIDFIKGAFIYRISFLLETQMNRTARIIDTTKTLTKSQTKNEMTASFFLKHFNLEKIQTLTHPKRTTPKAN